MNICDIVYAHKKRSLKKVSRGSSIKNRVSIHKRPSIIEKKDSVEDWEWIE